MTRTYRSIPSWTSCYPEGPADDCPFYRVFLRANCLLFNVYLPEGRCAECLGAYPYGADVTIVAREKPKVEGFDDEVSQKYTDALKAFSESDRDNTCVERGGNGDER